MKMTISVGRCLKRKTMLVWVKEYINKNFATCKSLCNLQEFYTAFKEKHSNVNIGFSKFCALKPKWCVLADSKMTYSVCVCSAHQNFVLLVDAIDWDLTYKDLIKLTLSCLVFPLRFICDDINITIILKSIFLTGTSLVHLI